MNQIKNEGRQLWKHAMVLDMTRPTQWFTRSVKDFSPDLRPLTDDAAWVDAPALGKHLRECTQSKHRNGERPLLVEIQHFDGSLQTNVKSRHYAMVHINWDEVDSDRQLFILGAVSGAIRDKVRWLARRDRKALNDYWTSGAMAKDVGEYYDFQSSRYVEFAKLPKREKDEEFRMIDGNF